MAKLTEALMTVLSVRRRKIGIPYRWYWYRHL
jgi:uncharacterized protein YcfL